MVVPISPEAVLKKPLRLDTTSSHGILESVMVKRPGVVTLNDCTVDWAPEITLMPSYSKVSARAAPAPSVQAASNKIEAGKNRRIFMMILSIFSAQINLGHRLVNLRPGASLCGEDAVVHAAVTGAVDMGLVVVIAAAIDVFVVQVSAQRAVRLLGIDGSAVAVLETHDQVLLSQPTQDDQGDIVAIDLASLFNALVDDAFEAKRSEEHT